MLQFDVGRKQSILAVEKAMSSDQLIFLATQKDIKDDNPKKGRNLFFWNTCQNKANFKTNR